MSMREVHLWVAYRKKYGAMHDVRRYDRPAAIIASILSQAHGGKATPKDFMPFGRNEEEITVQDIVDGFGEVKIGKRR
jgi:hypothetical protein